MELFRLVGEEQMETHTDQKKFFYCNIKQKSPPVSVNIGLNPYNLKCVTNIHMKVLNRIYFSSFDSYARTKRRRR